MLTNRANVPLPLAVWLAADDYDLIPRPNVISATSLLKPLKCIVLTQKIEQANIGSDIDLMDLVASRMGSAMHSAAEFAWINNLTPALTALGIPAMGQQTLRVNPNEVDPAYHNIFIEQRVERKLGEFIISGKYDFVENGRVKDIKTTGVYNWIHGGNDNKYAWQGSIYRWLDPKRIVDDVMDVMFIFTDWSIHGSSREKRYPAHRVMTRTLPLKPLPEVEHFMTVKTRNIRDYRGKPEKDLPRCTPEELWQQPTKWAYFKDPNKRARATKIYENQHQAMARQSEDGHVGIVERRPGKVKFCAYCSGRPICQQAEQYIQQGLLEI